MSLDEQIEQKEISRTQFLGNLRKQHDEILMEIGALQHHADTTEFYEASGSNVKYYVSTDGQVSYIVQEKEKMGF